MNQAQFHVAVRIIAAGHYFCTVIEANEHRAGDLRLEYRAYIDGLSWHSGPTGESVLKSLVSVPLPIETLDQLPVAEAR